MEALFILFVVVVFVLPAIFKNKNASKTVSYKNLSDSIDPKIKDQWDAARQALSTKAALSRRPEQTQSRAGTFRPVPSTQDALTRDTRMGNHSGPIRAKTLYKVPVQSRASSQSKKTTQSQYREAERRSEQASEQKREHIKNQHSDREATGSSERHSGEVKDLNRSRRSDWGTRSDREIITGESILVVTGLGVVALYVISLLT